MNNSKRNKGRHRDTKYKRNSRDHRSMEERKAVTNRPARDRRWKDRYESGELEDDDSQLLEEEDDFTMFEDDDDEEEDA